MNSYGLDFLNTLQFIIISMNNISVCNIFAEQRSIDAKDNNHYDWSDDDFQTTEKKSRQAENGL